MDGYKAAETLSNSTVVEIQMAGHVPGLFTDCGRSLVHLTEHMIHSFAIQAERLNVSPLAVGLRSVRRSRKFKGQQIVLYRLL